MENSIAPAVEGGPLELEIKDVTFISTTDKKEQGEGESGSYRSDPHLLQEEKPPLFRNQESLRIIQDYQHEELVRAKPSERSRGGRNSTQWSKVWRISILILTCFEGVEGVLTEEPNVSRFGGGCLAQDIYNS